MSLPGPAILDPVSLREGSVGRTGESGPGLGYGRERKDEFQLYGNFTMAKNTPVLLFRGRKTGRQ
jgi:hypothetical protein